MSDRLSRDVRQSARRKKLLRRAGVLNAIHALSGTPDSGPE
jgi:hypothetical protein